MPTGKNPRVVKTATNRVVHGQVVHVRVSGVGRSRQGTMGRRIGTGRLRQGTLGRARGAGGPREGTLGQATAIAAIRRHLHGTGRLRRRALGQAASISAMGRNLFVLHSSAMADTTELTDMTMMASTAYGQC